MIIGMKALPLSYSHTQKRTLIVALAAMTAFFFFVSNSTVSAQEEPGNSSITLTPSKKQHTVDAGKSISDTITVINSGSEPIEFTLFASPYTIKNEQYDADYETKSSSTNSYQWIKIQKTEYSLQPKQEAQVPYTMTVPEGAQPGGHYAVIFAQTTKPKGDESAIFRQKKIGALVYTTVNGDITRKGDVLGSEIAMLQVSPPLTTKLRIHNTGNTHFDATVKLTVRDILGSTKYKSENSYSVLPDTIRGITSQWKESPSYGLFKVQQQVSYLDKNYTAEKYVVMFPIWVLLVIVIIILLAVTSYLHRKGKI